MTNISFFGTAEPQKLNSACPYMLVLCRWTL